MVKFDDAAGRPSVCFMPSRLGRIWDFVTLSFFALISIGFISLAFIRILRTGNWMSELMPIAISGLFFVAAVAYIRKRWGLTMTITIDDDEVLIEERRHDVIAQTKRIHADQIESVYGKRLIGRGGSLGGPAGGPYEVWLKTRGQKDQCVANPVSSKADAIAIRHFLASHLNVAEIPEFANGMLTGNPFLKPTS